MSEPKPEPWLAATRFSTSPKAASARSAALIQPRTTTSSVPTLKLSLKSARVDRCLAPWAAASNARYPFLLGPDGAPITDWHHTLSHASPEDTPEMEKLIAIGEWHAQQFAYLLQSLSDRTDVDGRTLLDNTVILWAQELSEARFHTHQNMPFLLAGGGRLNTGRVVRVPDSTHNDLLLSCMHACGVEAEAVGDPALCTGGIDGLLV
jgi:hypothetical protein